MDYNFVITFVAVFCLNGVSSQTLYCNFEDSNICGFTQSSSDVFNWTRHSGSTSSSSTGPTYDHTLSTNTGHYMYIETSKPRTLGDNASLISPLQSPTAGVCLQFWYHMYGVHMGTLHVIIHQDGQNTSPIFTETGNQGNLWHQAGIAVESNVSSWKVEFEGITGSDYKSDIAIDDISITQGPCTDCSFDRDFCGWSNAVKEDFNWLRRTGNTPIRFTGPTVDHTQGSASGGYVYIESSDPRVAGDVAWLDSTMFPVFTSGIMCFNFWFHMYGADIGTLNVYIVNTDGTKHTLLWSQYGNQGNHWIQCTMPISSQSERYKIRFEGVRGSDDQGDIAIDDVSFRSSSQCRYTHCSPGKYGPQCTSSCLSANCRNNQCDRSSGYCAACTDNFTGNTCSDCSPGKYGPQCTSPCLSANCRNNQCDKSTGRCAACVDNYTGTNCLDCSPGKYGPQCTSSCLSANCRNNQCDRSTGYCAACPDNFTGKTCSDCSPGKYGPQCTSSCLSANCRNNQCDKSTGRCAACIDNFTGTSCLDCSPGKYGPQCKSSCLSANCRNNQCDRSTGYCAACPDNFTGKTCSDCSPGKYGPQCTSPCLSANCRNNQCDKSTGRCAACIDNFTGTSCLDCSPGKYGPQCTSSCLSANCRNNQCDRSTGYCAACTDNFTGNTCSECTPGKFGSDCSSSCLSSNCLNNECNATTRMCNACPDLFEGDLCSDCVPGRYGSGCSLPCLSSTCANNQCNRTTGLCHICLGNLDGGLCSALPSSHDWTLTIAGAAVGVGVLVIICVIVCICCLRRSRAKWETTEATAPPIPLSEMEPAPELRSPPAPAVEGAGAEADDPDSVYEKIRVSCIGTENNVYSEFPPQQAEATEPESLYVNVDFS